MSTDHYVGRSERAFIGSRAPSSLIEQESPNLRTGSKVEEQTQLKISGAQIIQYLGFVYRLQSGARFGFQQYLASYNEVGSECADYTAPEEHLERSLPFNQESGLIECQA